VDIPLETFIGATFTLGTVLVSITAWNVSLHGRVNGHDKLFEERKDQADERHEDVKQRLERIEQKLDRTLSMRYDR
jgi:hypothetical protein